MSALAVFLLTSGITLRRCSALNESLDRVLVDSEWAVRGWSQFIPFQQSFSHEASDCGTTDAEDLHRRFGANDFSLLHNARPSTVYGMCVSWPKYITS